MFVPAFPWCVSSGVAGTHAANALDPAQAELPSAGHSAAAPPVQPDCEPLRGTLRGDAVPPYRAHSEPPSAGSINQRIANLTVNLSTNLIQALEV